MSIFKHHRSDELIFAQNKKHRFGSNPFLNDNVIVVGSSGRGKTRQYIKANIMQMNSNYVIFDPNGHLVQELGTMLKKNGYLVQVLNFADMRQSEHYNPMFYLHKDSDVFSLIECLFSGLNICPNNSDHLWEKAAELLLSAAIFFLMRECLDEDRTLENALKLLRCHRISNYYDIESTLDVLMNGLAERDSEHIAVKQYTHFKNVSASLNTESNILVAAMACLQNFVLSDYADLTSENTVDIDSLSSRKSALFIVTSDTDRSRDWLYNLFFHQLLDVLCSRKRNDYTIHFFLDAFTLTGKILDFDQKLGVFHRHNLFASIILQDEAQLERVYGAGGARSIISNCDHYVFMGSNNIDLCEKVANRTGRESITGAKLQRLPRNHCVVISGGNSGVYHKYKLERHPRYKDIIDRSQNFSTVRTNPLYYNIYDNLSRNIPKKDEIVLEFKSTDRSDAIFVDRSDYKNDSSVDVKIEDYIGSDNQYNQFSLEESLGQEISMISEEYESIHNLVDDFHPETAVGDNIGSRVAESKGILSVQHIWDIGAEDVDNVSAVLVDTTEGLCLCIRGTGETENYSRYWNPPWFSQYRFDIKRVVVFSGVTALGNYLFADMPGLQEAEISSDVRSFGIGLFQDCNSLMKVDFEKSSFGVGNFSISNKMFMNCLSLETFSVPGECNSIQEDAFCGCSNLKQISFPSSLFEVAPSCFRGCSSLETIVSYNIEHCVNLLPIHLRTFIDRENIVFNQLELNFDDSRRYRIQDNTISFHKILAPSNFYMVLQESLADYIYHYFSLSTRSKQMFLNYRYDTYRNIIENGLFSIDSEIKSALDNIFENDFTHFKFFFSASFVKYTEGKTYIYSKEIASYNDFLHDVHIDIIVKNYEEDLIGVFNELLGNEKEKKITFKVIKNALINRSGYQFTDTVFREILDRLVARNLINMTKSSRGYIYSFPSTDDVSVMESKYESDELETVPVG